MSFPTQYFVWAGGEVTQSRVGHMGLEEQN